MAEAHVDATRCPLCGGDNACAMAASGDPARCATCWCQHVRIDASAVARIPDGLRGRACLCRGCATGGGKPSEDPRPDRE